MALIVALFRQFYPWWFDAPEVDADSGRASIESKPRLSP